MQLLKKSVDFWDSIDYDGLRWTYDSFRRSHLIISNHAVYSELVKLIIKFIRIF